MDYNLEGDVEINPTNPQKNHSNSQPKSASPVRSSPPKKFVGMPDPVDFMSSQKPDSQKPDSEISHSLPKVLEFPKPDQNDGKQMLLYNLIQQNLKYSDGTYINTKIGQPKKNETAQSYYNDIQNFDRFPYYEVFKPSGITKKIGNYDYKQEEWSGGLYVYGFFNNKRILITSIDRF